MEETFAGRKFRGMKVSREESFAGVNFREWETFIFRWKKLSQLASIFAHFRTVFSEFWKILHLVGINFRGLSKSAKVCSHETLFPVRQIITKNHIKKQKEAQCFQSYEYGLLGMCGVGKKCIISMHIISILVMN